MSQVVRPYMYAVLWTGNIVLDSIMPISPEASSTRTAEETKTHDVLVAGSRPFHEPYEVNEG